MDSTKFHPNKYGKHFLGGGGGLQFGVYQQYFNIQHCAAHFVKLKGSQLNPDSIIQTR